MQKHLLFLLALFGLLTILAANAQVQAPKELLEIKTGADFKETPVGVVVEFLADLTDCEFVLDKAIDEDTPITIAVEKGTVKDILDQLTGQLKLTYQYKVAGEKVKLIARPADPPKDGAAKPISTASKATKEKLERKISVNFSQTPMSEVANFLSKASDLSIVLGGGVPRKAGHAQSRRHHHRTNHRQARRELSHRAPRTIHPLQAAQMIIHRMGRGLVRHFALPLLEIPP